MELSLWNCNPKDVQEKSFTVIDINKGRLIISMD